MFEIKETSVSYLTEQKSQPKPRYRQCQYSKWKQAPPAIKAATVDTATHLFPHSGRCQHRHSGAPAGRYADEGFEVFLWRL